MNRHEDKSSTAAEGSSDPATVPSMPHCVPSQACLCPVSLQVGMELAFLVSRIHKVRGGPQLDPPEDEDDGVSPPGIEQPNAHLKGSHEDEVNISTEVFRENEGSRGQGGADEPPGREVGPGTGVGCTQQADGEGHADTQEGPLAATPLRLSSNTSWPQLLSAYGLIHPPVSRLVERLLLHAFASTKESARLLESSEELPVASLLRQLLSEGNFKDVIVTAAPSASQPSDSSQSPQSQHSTDSMPAGSPAVCSSDSGFSGSDGVAAAENAEVVLLQASSSEQREQPLQQEQASSLSSSAASSDPEAPRQREQLDGANLHSAASAAVRRIRALLEEEANEAAQRREKSESAEDDPAPLASSARGPGCPEECILASGRLEALFVPSTPPASSHTDDSEEPGSSSAEEDSATGNTAENQREGPAGLAALVLAVPFESEDEDLGASAPQVEEDEPAAVGAAAPNPADGSLNLPGRFCDGNLQTQSVPAGRGPWVEPQPEATEDLGNEGQPCDLPQEAGSAAHAVDSGLSYLNEPLSVGCCLSPIALNEQGLQGETPLQPPGATGNTGSLPSQDVQSQLSTTQLGSRDRRNSDDPPSPLVTGMRAAASCWGTVEAPETAALERQPPTHVFLRSMLTTLPQFPASRCQRTDFNRRRWTDGYGGFPQSGQVGLYEQRQLAMHQQQQQQQQQQRPVPFLHDPRPQLTARDGPHATSSLLVTTRPSFPRRGAQTQSTVEYASPGSGRAEGAASERSHQTDPLSFPSSTQAETVSSLHNLDERQQYCQRSAHALLEPSAFNRSGHPTPIQMERPPREFPLRAVLPEEGPPRPSGYSAQRQLHVNSPIHAYGAGAPMSALRSNAARDAMLDLTSPPRYPAETWADGGYGQFPFFADRNASGGAVAGAGSSRPSAFAAEAQRGHTLPPRPFLRSSGADQGHNTGPPIASDWSLHANSLAESRDREQSFFPGQHLRSARRREGDSNESSQLLQQHVVEQWMRKTETHMEGLERLMQRLLAIMEAVEARELGLN